jgi:hypothetical protein
MRGYRTTARGRVGLGFAEDVEEEMREFTGGDGCMRRVMDEAMDGTNER